MGYHNVVRQISPPASQSYYINIEERREVSSSSVTITPTPEPTPTPRPYSDEDIYWLSHIIMAEAGSENCSDELQLMVGNVVLNRTIHEKYPDTIYEVIHQKGQYSPVKNGSIKKEPTERVMNNTIMLLDGYRCLPDNVIFQANFRQGKTYKKVKDGGTTMYFGIKE